MVNELTGKTNKKTWKVERVINASREKKNDIVKQRQEERCMMNQGGVS